MFKKLPVGPLPRSHFHRGAKAADKDDHIVYDAKHGVLIYDKNGSEKGGDQVFAKLDKNTDLHNSDFPVKDPATCSSETRRPSPLTSPGSPGNR